MTAFRAKTFRATLGSSGDRLRWVIAAVPFDVKEAWPGYKGRRVHGQINGFPFRTSLFPNTRDGGHMLLVNKAVQAGAGAKAGQRVAIRLEPDLEERPAALPAELARLFKGERDLRKWFDALGPSLRRWIVTWAGEPTSAEGRERRAEQCAEWLLLAMEGEQELPPILRLAFSRQPGAGDGWAAMSAVRRRNHLLSVFHCQSPEARERRVRTVVEDALKVSAKTRSRPGQSPDCA